MRIVERKIHCSALYFNSVNDTIKVSIDFTNGPQLKLDDNSILIFKDNTSYYSALSKNILTAKNFDEELLNKLSSSVEIDDVNDIFYEDGHIVEVAMYVLDSRVIYKFKLA